MRIAKPTTHSYEAIGAKIENIQKNTPICNTARRIFVKVMEKCNKDNFDGIRKIREVREVMKERERTLL